MSLADTIVADASPIIIAARTELLPHMPSLLGRIYIPPAVAEECAHPFKEGSQAVKQAIERNTLTVSDKIEHEFLSRIPHGIDTGEAEAIALALNLHARLLIDDRKGRRIAKHEGLHILGFGAVLVKAKRSGIIPAVLPVIKQMSAMRYHIAESMVKEILALCGE